MRSAPELRAVSIITQVDAAEALEGELLALLVGRGVRRPRCRDWLGPELQRILRLDASASDELCRQRLIDLIRKETARLPSDLKQLYRLASGIDGDARFQRERLKAAEKLLDRGPRTLRRKLRRAEQMMAASLASQYPRNDHPYTDQGWHWEEYSVDLDLAPAEPTATITRRIRALFDGQQVVREVFSVPRSAVGHAIRFEALEGCELDDVVQTSPSIWVATFRLPVPLATGYVQRTLVRATFDSLDAVAPFVAHNPVRPCSRYEVTVRVGDPSRVASIWRIDGFMTATVLDEQPGPDAVTVGPGAVRTATFNNLMNGLVYGLGWTWAERIGAVDTTT